MVVGAAVAVVTKVIPDTVILRLTPRAVLTAFVRDEVSVDCLKW